MIDPGIFVTRKNGKDPLPRLADRGNAYSFCLAGNSLK